MFKLAPYDVVVWHQVDPALHERIIERAGRRPDEGTEMQGMRDMHWGFETAQEATEFAESLLEVAALEDVVLLTINASRDENFGRKVYKDNRAKVIPK